MKLILVRHCETQWNHEQRAQGSTDIALNENGLRQAEALAHSLKNENIAAVYSSPLSRAMVTAQTIARHHALTVVPDDNLRELDMGLLDGLTGAEMRQQYPELLKEWAIDPGPLKMPEGESLNELQERAWRAVLRAKDNHGDGTVLMVSHNLTIQSVICKAIALPLANFRRLRQNVGAMNVLALDGAAISLLRLNDTCHLKQAL